MTLIPFNLDKQIQERLMLLIHSQRGHGKTHLIGDMLRTEAANGPVRFLNIKGEDGALSISEMGLGNIGVTAESAADFDQAVDQFRKDKIHALGVDSLAPLADLTLYEIVGETRLPDAKRDGERSKAYWGQLRWQMQQRLAKLRYAAKIVLCTCPSDKSTNDITGNVAITPDLFGRLAHGSAGWFDFVGYLTADVIGAGKMERKVTFAPSSGVVTKQRIARPILETIKIPEDQGGWTAIWTLIQERVKSAK